MGQNKADIKTTTTSFIHKVKRFLKTKDPVSPKY